MKYCNITHFEKSEQISEHYFGNQSKRREIIEYIFR